MTSPQRDTDKKPWLLIVVKIVKKLFAALELLYSTRNVASALVITNQDHYPFTTRSASDISWGCELPDAHLLIQL